MAGLVSTLGESRRSPNIITYPVLSTTSFVAGDWVTLDTNGKLQIAGSTGADLGNVKPVGIANENSYDNYLGATKQFATVKVLEPAVGQFLMPLYHSSASSAVYNTNLVGNEYDVYYVSAGVWAVDLTSSTYQKVRIIGPAVEDYPGYPITTGAGTIQYPFVWVESVATLDLLTGARS